MNDCERNGFRRLRRTGSCGLILAMLAGGMAAAGCSTTRPTPVVRRSADWHYERDQFAAAAEQYREMTERVPGDWRAQYRLGRCMLELDRPDDARRALEVANNLKPRNSEITDALAQAMYEQGAQNELFAFLRQRADESREPRDYLTLARYAMLAGDIDTANVSLLTAIEVDEGRSVEPYLSRAAFAATLGNRGEVVRRLRQAYGISPQDPRVISRLEEYDQVLGPTLPLPPGQ